MTSDMGEIRATSGRAIRVRNERHNEDWELISIVLSALVVGMFHGRSRRTLISSIHFWMVGKPELTQMKA
jgi:hypothetical protein